MASSPPSAAQGPWRSEEHTSELQPRIDTSFHTLSLHDALPICLAGGGGGAEVGHLHRPRRERLWPLRRRARRRGHGDRKSTRLNSSHVSTPRSTLSPYTTRSRSASPGEEAGLKAATFIARGENAYGLFAAERGEEAI